MGNFANLYLIEADTISENEITIKTTVFCGQAGKIPYFSWLPGERPTILYSYAGESIYSDMLLEVLVGYPVVDRQILGAKTGQTAASALIEAQFNPKLEKWATVYHFLLPKRFLPRRDLKPLEQPRSPYVKVINDRMILTWPAVGPTDIRFCISQLGQSEKFSDYDLSKILVSENSLSTKFGLEINLGVIKFKFG